MKSLAVFCACAAVSIALNTYRVYSMQAEFTDYKNRIVALEERIAVEDEGRREIQRLVTEQLKAGRAKCRTPAKSL